MAHWDKEKIRQLADKSKKPLETRVLELGIVESRFVASLMTKAELQKALDTYEALLEEEESVVEYEDYHGSFNWDDLQPIGRDGKVSYED